MNGTKEERYKHFLQVLQGLEEEMKELKQIVDNDHVKQLEQIKKKHQEEIVRIEKEYQERKKKREKDFNEFVKKSREISSNIASTKQYQPNLKVGALLIIMEIAFLLFIKKFF